MWHGLTGTIHFMPVLIPPRIKILSRSFLLRTSPDSRVHVNCVARLCSADEDIKLMLVAGMLIFHAPPA
jgi:hypothetical protein